ASSDPNAVLPGDYTFTAGDNGAHSFSGTLNSAGYQTVAGTHVGNDPITGPPRTFPITQFTVPTADSGMTAATLGADGNIWFTESNPANKIGRIAPGGYITEFTIPTSNAGLWGIAAGPDGNIWFTEFSGNQIGRLTPTGVLTEFSLPGS